MPIATDPPAGGPPLTGGAAVLARIRAQRAASAQRAADKPAPATPLPIAVLFASQTGTAREIARNISAEATAKGLKAEAKALDEVKTAGLGRSATPILVVVAASTGDGDAPDNAVKTVAELKRAEPNGQLAGVKFTVLGLGDSNYTRFMQVPRTIKNKLLELGATEFYASVEADEVNGLDDVIDPWLEGLLPALQKESKPTAATVVAAKAPTPAATPVATVTPPAADVAPAKPGGVADGWIPVPSDWDLRGVPALVQSTVELQWVEDPDKAKQLQETEGPTQQQLAFRSPTGDYTAETPFWSTISRAQLLTHAESDRRVLHVDFDITDSGITFQPGDSVSVLPQNNKDLVQRLLTRLGVDGARVLAAVTRKNSAGPKALPHMKTPCTLQHAFTNFLDVTSPAKKSLLRLLAEHCQDPAERRQLLYLTSPAGREQYSKLIMEGQPSLLDLLLKTPSCTPPLDALLEALPPLAPRPYSLTNSPSCGDNVLQVALSVVRAETVYGTKLGVASTWLDTLTAPILQDTGSQEPAKVAIYMRKGGSFRAPATLDKHWIMVGPGTGVAPFMGFLQDRRHRIQAGEKATGEAWLFFGCRKADEDYLYQNDIQSFRDDGTLSCLQVAFSRVGPDKVYVQHLMKQQGEKLASMIREGAYVFVCGDGFKMAKDVHATLAELLGDGGEQLLLQLGKSGQYVRDIWS